MKEELAVSMQQITKVFGEVMANQNVSFELKKGEIHSILGENGAGKSSLMNILSGIYVPDSGSVFLCGKEVELKSPRDAIHHGIGMIHQHFKLIPVYSALENILLGYPTEFFIRYKTHEQKIQALSQKYGLEVDLNKKIISMSVAEKQRVEILKVLYRGAEVLILDEPTAVLTTQEADNLFKILYSMKKDGKSVVIITHKFAEVLEISDRITILRKGCYIDTVINDQIIPQELADKMVGKSVDLAIRRTPVTTNAEALLEVRELSILGHEKKAALKNMTFTVHGGEILGVAGVAGSGQKELCEALVGLEHIKSGDVLFQGDSLVGKSPREIISKGISMSFVPEDRLGMGLVANMDIVHNVLLKEYQKQHGQFISRKSSRVKANHLIEKLNIDTPSAEHPVRLLSGGNIQKVLLGRELDNNPHLIITAYPSRGLDIGSSHQVYDLINEQKEKGVGVLFVGEDLDVLLEISDRLMILCSGEITGIVDPRTTSKEKIGLMMSGKRLEDIHD